MFASLASLLYLRVAVFLACFDLDVLVSFWILTFWSLSFPWSPSLVVLGGLVLFACSYLIVFTFLFVSRLFPGVSRAAVSTLPLGVSFCRVLSLCLALVWTFWPLARFLSTVFFRLGVFVGG